MHVIHVHYLLLQHSFENVDIGGWVRAVENHGIRPLPFRIRSKYSPEDERYQKKARYVSLYYDAPVSTRNELELAVRLDEKILRFNTLKLKSVVDEVSF